MFGAGRQRKFFFMKEQEKLPQHLKHKPIISVYNFKEIDASYANKTDVKALSIGSAQWDSDQISLKVWRHTGVKWNRQSEELPIHRNLDLSILFLAALSTDVSDCYSKSNLGETVDNQEGVQDIKAFYKENEKFIKPRLKELKRLLDEIV